MMEVETMTKTETERKHDVNRQELLFIFECRDCNPNGDPLDEDKVRINPDTDQAFITDVRLKRTIRDHIRSKYPESKDNNSNNVFFAKRFKDSGEPFTKQDTLKKFEATTRDDILSKFVDIRLFGATLAEKGDDGGKSLRHTLTGPVQFRIAKSLNKPKMRFIQGTSVFPSKKGNKQGTFTERYMIDYGVFAAYGILNQYAAKDTNLTNDDIELLYDGIFYGTKNLNTRSKIGHNPLALLVIEYQPGSDYFIGDLDTKLGHNKDETAVRNCNDVTELKIVSTNIMKKIKDNADKIESIKLFSDHGKIEIENKEIGTKLENISKTWSDIFGEAEHSGNAR